MRSTSRLCSPPISMQAFVESYTKDLTFFSPSLIEFSLTCRIFDADLSRAITSPYVRTNQNKTVFNFFKHK